MSETNIVRATGLVKHFRREDQSLVRAIDDIELEVRPGEFVVLLGPSGCGKTTLLRCIAGLEKPDQGTIEIQGRKVFDSATKLVVPPERRQISMIFQSYALWPHMSAFDNVAYPLHSRGVAKSSIAGRVRDTLKQVGISELERQYPAQMSGGQQQRVALARAIISNDGLVLFDEPLSNVDAKVREHLRIELLEMQRKLSFSALYVTHDQTEAMALAHRIAILREGRIVQIGSPREVYEQPLTRYVARFVGTTNELDATIVANDAGAVRVSTGLGELSAAAPPGFNTGDKAAVVFRPEHCVLSSTEPNGPVKWQGTIQAALFLGSHVEHIVGVGGRTFLEWSTGSALREPGTSVWLSVAPEHVRAVRLDQADT